MLNVYLFLVFAVMLIESSSQLDVLSTESILELLPVESTTSSILSPQNWQSPCSKGTKYAKVVCKRRVQHKIVQHDQFGGSFQIKALEN